MEPIVLTKRESVYCGLSTIYYGKDIVTGNIVIHLDRSPLVLKSLDQPCIGVSWGSTGFIYASSMYFTYFHGLLTWKMTRATHYDILANKITKTPPKFAYEIEVWHNDDYVARRVLYNPSYYVVSKLGLVIVNCLHVVFGDGGCDVEDRTPITATKVGIRYSDGTVMTAGKSTAESFVVSRTNGNKYIYARYTNKDRVYETTIKSLCEDTHTGPSLVKSMNHLYIILRTISMGIKDKQMIWEIIEEDCYATVMFNIANEVHEFCLEEC
jgi:hypothetical protein